MEQVTSKPYNRHVKATIGGRLAGRHELLTIVQEISENSRRGAAIARWFGFACLVASANAVAAPAPDIPPMPAYADLPLATDHPVAPAAGSATGTLTWIGTRPIKDQPRLELPLKTGQCWAWELVSRSWNPATGATTEQALNLPGMVVHAAPVPAGILALTTLGCQTPNGKDRLRLGLLTPQGKHLTLETGEPLGAMPIEFLPMDADTTVLVTRTKDARHIMPYVLRRQGEALALEHLPELPIAYRRDYGVALAGSGTATRLMIIGGSDGQYRGCMECRDESHVLDLKARTWSAGPKLLEARSELTAATLPDGSVLVTGGWTKQAEWGHGPSATAERWNPSNNQFEAVAPMPTGTARHRMLWLPGQEGRTLTVVEGLSGTAQAYDFASQTWRTVGEWVQGSEEGGCGFYPFTRDGNTYAWLLNKAEGHYSSKSCVEQKYADLSLLRPALGTKPAAVPPESLLITYRSGSAFVPAATRNGSDWPALVIGGSTHAGMNAYLMTSTVEAVGRDGRIWTLPPLNHARHGAQAFRFGDGVLVAGGQVAWSHLDREAAAKTPPMEWLPVAPGGRGAAGSKWVDVPGLSLAADTALTQLADGSLLEIDGNGGVQQLQPMLAAGVPTLERSAWPSLRRARRSTDKDQVRVRQLPDGRIVVAGGWVQAEKIALLKPDSELADATDEYIGIGEFLPSRRHEIWDSAAKRWITTAASSAAGGNVTILDDGRVLKLGMTQPRAPAEAKALLEISTANGTGWAPVPATGGSRMRMTDRFREFTLDGELFASGDLEGVDTGGGPSGVEWLNQATGRWEVLWQAPEKDNWRSHVGRLLVRTLANGKVVVLPAEGL